MEPAVVNRRPYTFSLLALLGVILLIAIALAAWRLSQRTKTIEPDSWVLVNVVGTPPDNPIQGYYYVDPNGDVNLGPGYPVVNLAGKSTADARVALIAELQATLLNPQAAITLAPRNIDKMDPRVFELERQVQRIEAMNRR